MFDRWKLKRLVRQLGSSLERDDFQSSGWDRWAGGSAASVAGLITACDEPGWLAHLGCWLDLPEDRLVAGAMAVARLCEDEQDERPSFYRRHAKTLERWKDVPTDALADIIVDAETRFTAAGALVARARVTVGLQHALFLNASRFRSELERSEHPLASDGVGTADLGGEALGAASVALAVIAALNREHGHRESVAAAAAKSIALSVIAQHARKDEMLVALRRAYGW